MRILTHNAPSSVILGNADTTDVATDREHTVVARALTLNLATEVLSRDEREVRQRIADSLTERHNKEEEAE